MTQVPLKQNKKPSLIIEPEELAPRLEQENLLIIDLCNPQVYQQLHVPGAVHLMPQQLMSGVQPAAGKLPSLAQLETLFQQLGYTEDKFIVVYDDEGGGWAGRFIWTLDMIGHQNYAYLNGGVHAWLKEGHPVEKVINQPEPTSISLTLDDSTENSARADRDYILANLDNPQVQIWDARSPEEYRGERVLARRGGHIPGAINFEWTQAMDSARNYRIREDLQPVLLDLGLNVDHEVITHCQSHHRSGFAYLVAKMLGFRRVKAYDGSWSEWGNLSHTPVEQ